MSAFTTSLTRRQRGVAALEFAVVAMLVLLPMALGIWQLGKAMSEYNTLVKAVRDATRYLTLHPAETRTEAARCLARFGKVSVDTSGRVSCPYAESECLIPTPDGSGCTYAAANVHICEARSCPTTHQQVNIPGVGRINLATVSIEGYTFRSWVPNFISDIAFARPISNTMRAPL